MDLSFSLSPGAGFLLVCAFFLVSGISFLMGVFCHDDLVHRIPPDEEHKYFPPKDVDNKNV